jgi:hypothetical protein
LSSSSNNKATATSTVLVVIRPFGMS